MKQNEKAFLSMYFGAEALLGWNVCDKQKLFDTLADVFGVEKKSRPALVTACNDSTVRSIRSLEDYMMYMRALDFEERYGAKPEQSEEVRFAIECKGEAFKSLYPMMEDCGLYPSENKLRAALNKPENNNLVGVAALGAFLYFEGLVFRKDVKKGVELAEKCLHWNNVDGILLLLAYGESKKREYYLSVLTTLIDREGSAEDYTKVLATLTKQGEAFSPAEETLLVADYLDRHPTERPMYDAVVSKIVRSPLIGTPDKKRLLCSDGKNAVAFLSDLAVEKGAEGSYDKIWEFVAENRKKEGKQLDLGLRKQSAGTVLTPTLVCEDEVARHILEEALFKAANGKIPVVNIDATRVTKSTFAPTKGNEIIKALVRENTAKAVFVVTGADELGAEESEQLATMINAKNKANYTLADINVGVDLTGCSFVLVSATKDVHESLRAQVFFIAVGKASEEEKRSYVDGVFATQKNAYECRDLVLTKEAKAVLVKKDVEYVCAAIEGVCHEHSYDETRYEVTAEDLEKAVRGAFESQMAFVIKK